MIVELQSAFCINNQTNEEKEISFNEMNKYSCYSNKDYTLILKYVRELELRLNSKNKTTKIIKRELKKVQEVDSLLEKKFKTMVY